MKKFVPGQRWLSETQTELGLGVVTATEGRYVRMAFPATGETRLYALREAPLSRVAFRAGEQVRNLAGDRLVVTGASEQGGVLTYLCEDLEGRASKLSEAQLDPTLKVNRPGQRLFSVRLDRDDWFSLRYRTWLRGMGESNSEVLGLVGPRVSPIPHQLYIAAEVAARYAPRVLLADEVGLGKTIEAGLILHRLLLAGRIARVLILVPEPLLHQWLVEMLRRFNLRFTLYDQERIEQAADNPFSSEQRVLCPLELLTSLPSAARAALEGEWDMVIVDEAHHLTWSETESSLEYDLVAALAEQTPAILLLTATPEQLGRAGHFARLRLLDPHRWSDYNAFLAEEAGYECIARLAARLLDEEPLTAEEEELRASLPDGLGQMPDERLIDALLDRHGTGRVLFRNTRAAIPGFPEREPVPHPLPQPHAYALLGGDAVGCITPERLYGDGWAQLDPRVGWLAATTRVLRPAKIVVICAHAETVIDLRRVLLEREGIHAAIFHEGMAIIERDRAAAFFADAEEGAQVLLCSEIGSEGRNFQFAHHLVLFDLPLDPELLEQRIGRLDRIGQTETVRIHIPYLEAGPGETLFRWYQDGLDAFSSVCPSAPAVYEGLRGALHAALEDATRCDALIKLARHERERITADLAAGRDRLLELHSYRPGAAVALVDAIEQQDASRDLYDYMTQVWDGFGVENEPGPGATQVLHPGAHMLHEHFPELPEEGLTLTLDRGVALAHEDREFLTWEHPMVRAAMEMVTGSDLGSCALTVLRDPVLPAGTLLLEMIQIAQCPAPPELEVGRYLPPTAVRLLLDAQGRDLSEQIPHKRLRGQCLTRNRKLAHAVVKSKGKLIEQLIERGGQLATAAAEQLEGVARECMHRELDAELERLRALSRVNPGVRSEELDYLETRRELLTRHLTRVRLYLDALRVIMIA